jgi:hypothetical protein
MLWNASGEVTMVRKRQAPSFAASYTPDPRAGEFVELGALTADLTVNNPITNNKAKGARLTLRILQDGTGGHNVTFGNEFVHGWSNTGNTASKRSTITFEYDGSKWVQIGAQSPYA